MGKGGFSVFQHFPRTIPSIKPYTVTPTDSALEKYIYIYSFIYLFLLLRKRRGYFFTVSFAAQFPIVPFITQDVTTFFVSAVQMLRLVLAHRLLLDIKRFVVSKLAFMSVNMVITSLMPYKLICCFTI